LINYWDFSAMRDCGHRAALMSTGKYAAYICTLCRYGPEPCGTMCTLDYWHGNFRKNATTPTSLNISYHVNNVNILRTKGPFKGIVARDGFLVLSSLSKVGKEDLKCITRLITEI
jgi:hypothetical protein